VVGLELKEAERCRRFGERVPDQVAPGRRDVPVLDAEDEDELAANLATAGPCERVVPRGREGGVMDIGREEADRGQNPRVKRILPRRGRAQDKVS